MTTHTVGTLLKAVPEDALVEAVARLYHEGDETHRNLTGYREVRAKLLAKTPVAQAMDCVLTPEDDGVDVHGREPDNPTYWAIGFMPWAEWLGMTVVVEGGLVLTEAEQLAHILWEMTFYGWEEEDVEDVKATLDERLEEVERSVTAPTHRSDGTPVSSEELARVHEKLLSGEMKIEFAPGAEEDLAKAGISKDDMKKMLLGSMKKGAN